MELTTKLSSQSCLITYLNLNNISFVNIDQFTVKWLEMPGFLLFFFGVHRCTENRNMRWWQLSIWRVCTKKIVWMEGNEKKKKKTVGKTIQQSVALQSNHNRISILQLERNMRVSMTLSEQIEISGGLITFMLLLLLLPFFYCIHRLYGLYFVQYAFVVWFEQCSLLNLSFRFEKWRESFRRNLILLSIFRSIHILLHMIHEPTIARPFFQYVCILRGIGKNWGDLMETKTIIAISLFICRCLDFHSRSMWHMTYDPIWWKKRKKKRKR